MSGFEILRRTLLTTYDEDGPQMPSLPLGRLRDGNMRDGELACWHSTEGHAAVVGATGRGKSAYVAIPWLLAHEGPAVVVDVKGELYRKTSRHRSSLGPVAALDPFGMLPAHVDRACLNPMAYSEGTSENDTQELLRSFAETVQPVGQGEASYWDNSAQNLIYVAALIAREKHGSAANPGHVNAILNRGKVRLMEDIKEAATAQGTLGLSAGAMLGGFQVDNTFACYMLGASRAMMFLVPEGVAEAVSSTTVDPTDILSRNGTLYLVMPEDKLSSHAGLVRMWLGGVLRAARLMGDDQGRNALFLVDEAGNLGNMREVMLALTLGRSKGIRLATFWQDMAQMRAAYGEEGRMFMSNSSLRLFLGTNDLQDSRYISEVLGSDTRGLPLLNPEQVRAVPKGVLLACQDGKFPMALDAIHSWKDETTASLLGIVGEEWADWCARRLELVTRPSEHAIAGHGRDGQGRLFVPVPVEKPSPMMRAQRSVFDALRLSEGAPKGVTVIYDKARVPPVERGDPYSSQIDVIVLDGTKGVLVIEVKGGMLRWKADEAAWEVRTLKGREWRPCKDPYEQVRNCAYALVESLRREGLPYVQVRTAVAFPDMDGPNGTVPADAANVLTYWKGDLPVLWERLGEDWKGGTMPMSVRNSIVTMTYGRLDMVDENKATRQEELLSPLGELPNNGSLLEARKAMICVLTAARHIAAGIPIPAWAAKGVGRRLAMVEGLDPGNLEVLVARGLREYGAEGFLHALDRECRASWVSPIQPSVEAVEEKEMDNFDDLFSVSDKAEYVGPPQAVVNGWNDLQAKKADYYAKSNNEHEYCSKKYKAWQNTRLDLARLCTNQSNLLRFMDALCIDAYEVTRIPQTLDEAISKASTLPDYGGALAEASLYMAWKKGADMFGEREPPVGDILACTIINGRYLLRYLNSLSRKKADELSQLTMVDYVNDLAKGAVSMEYDMEFKRNEEGKLTHKRVDDSTLDRVRRDWPTSEKMPRYANP